MKIKFNNLYLKNKTIITQLVKSFVNHIKSSDFIGGSAVQKFEKNFKKINNSKYCISCGNGSDALVIAIKALGLKQGDEVITTALSWIATSAAITMAGGKIIFCDIEKDGFNIDPKLIKSKITKKTVGIIPVHLYGYPADMKNIMKIAKQNKLWVIEDCAQSHTATVNKKTVGNFGAFGTFSFFPGKNIGALGDAGCLVTNNKKLAKISRLIANHGGKGKHLLEGINSRMDSIQASFLDIKLKSLIHDTNKRIQNSKIYFQNLKIIKNIKLPKNISNYKNVYHQFVIRAQNRNRLKENLFKNGIDAQIHYRQILPMMKAYKNFNYKASDFPNAIKASKEILSLPISPEVKTKSLKYISKVIVNFFSN